MVNINNEGTRRVLQELVNLMVGNMTEREARFYLEKVYHGQIFNTQELTQNYKVLSFLAPFVQLERLDDNKIGYMMFTHNPRFYFGFQIL